MSLVWLYRWMRKAAYSVFTCKAVAVDTALVLWSLRCPEREVARSRKIKKKKNLIFVA